MIGGTAAMMTTWPDVNRTGPTSKPKRYGVSNPPMRPVEPKRPGMKMAPT